MLHKLGTFEARKNGMIVLIFSSIFKARETRTLNRRFVDALWQWRRVKTSTDSVGQSLQKEFLIDDTGSTPVTLDDF